jgi:hypothetical protein
VHDGGSARRANGCRRNDAEDAASASRARTAHSPSRSAGRISRSGTSARAWATEVPRARPSAAADARATSTALDTGGTTAVDAAADAEQARSELEILAEHYILKRTQAVALKWAIERYRERH